MILARNKAKAISLSLAAVALALACAAPAVAQKKGGTLHVYAPNDPPSMSIIEETSASVTGPFMAVYNNLVIFDQQNETESAETIQPELAESWSWDSTGTKLTFKLREGVQWHDGKPFTAKDVQCTWRMLIGKREDQKLRANPRSIWYSKLDDVTTNGDYEVTFNLTARHPALLSLLASGFSAVYPCHVPPEEMRKHPIGTGPFKFVDYRRGEGYELVRNPNYWKKDRPYLDAIEYDIITSRATRILALTSGQIDLSSPVDFTVGLMRDAKEQAPGLMCKLRPAGVSTNMIVNSEVPPFDNPRIREAMALALDRDAFSKIQYEGQAMIGGNMMPKPAGVWGIPDDKAHEFLGYGPNMDPSEKEARLKQAQKIMEELGYGPDNPLETKVSTRKLAAYTDAAVILVDQLKQIYISGELEPLETAQYFAAVAQGDYAVALNHTGVAVDDPDANLMESYACESPRNLTRYCRPEVEKLLHAQSSEVDKERRQQMVYEIEKLIAQEGARSIIQHTVLADCWQPYVKGYVVHNNSFYNNTRFEDVWLDK